MDLPAAQSRFCPDCGCDRGDGCGSRPLHGQRRAGDSAAGRLLRRLDNQLDCGSFQGNSWIHRLVKMTDALSALGAEKFVSLTTFKKDGTPVAAPITSSSGHRPTAGRRSEPRTTPGSCWCHAAVVGRTAKALSRWMGSPK